MSAALWATLMFLCFWVDVLSDCAWVERRSHAQVYCHDEACAAQSARVMVSSGNLHAAWSLCIVQTSRDATHSHHADFPYLTSPSRSTEISKRSFTTSVLRAINDSSTAAEKAASVSYSCMHCKHCNESMPPAPGLHPLVM